MIIRHQHDKGPIGYYDSVLTENVMADTEKWCYWLYSYGLQNFVTASCSLVDVRRYA